MNLLDETGHGRFSKSWVRSTVLVLLSAWQALICGICASREHVDMESMASNEL